MSIGKISVFGAAVPLLVFTLGCCGAVCPRPVTIVCAPPRPVGQSGCMPALPPPRSPECPPTAMTCVAPILNHNLGGNMTTNSSAVKVMTTNNNRHSSRNHLPAKPSARPAGSIAPAPATAYRNAGDQPVTAKITVQYPVPVPNGNLCGPGEHLGDCYTLPENESPSSAAGIELYVPGVVDSGDVSVSGAKSKAEEPAEAVEPSVVEEVAAPIGEVAESAILLEQAADASVADSIAEAGDVDATVTLVQPGAEAPIRQAEVAIPVPMPPPVEHTLAEKVESATLEAEIESIATAKTPAMPSAMDGLEDRAYLAMPRLPSEMSRERAIVEDRLNTKVELDGLRTKENDTGIPMVELPPKLD